MLKLLRKALFWAIALPLAVVTVFVLWLVWPQPCDAQITCESDAQCGGSVTVREFCRDGNVYGEGQRNTCENAGTCEATCVTNYQPWLLAECANGCENGACL